MSSAPRRKPPSYRQHASGQGVVRLNGKDFYLGVYDTPASLQAYDRLIAEWYASGRQITPKATAGQGPTVGEVVKAFLAHAESYYIAADGQSTSELCIYRTACRPLLKLYGTTPAREFGPLALKAVRQEMIRMGWTRRSLNKQVNRIRSIFKWAASQEIVAASICEALRTLSGLQPGRGGAKETLPVRPVPQAQVDAVLPFVSEQVRAIVQLQLRTGARAGELLRIRPIDIDMTGDVWTYTPAKHKTAHRGHKRIIYIGPKGQEIIRPFLIGRSVDAYLFSATEAEEQRREQQHAERKTPLGAGNMPGSNRTENAERRPGLHYTIASYRRAIDRACEDAFPLPPDLARHRVKGARGKNDLRWETMAEWKKRIGDTAWGQVKAWRKAHHWHPHQLRHNAATHIRREFGLEFSQVVLGHQSLDMTQLYAEADQAKAQEVIRRIG